MAEAGCELLENCTSASVTLVAAGRPLTMAASDEVATEMDQAQYDADDGPCLTAARQERIFRIEDLAADEGVADVARSAAAMVWPARCRCHCCWRMPTHSAP